MELDNIDITPTPELIEKKDAFIIIDIKGENIERLTNAVEELTNTIKEIHVNGLNIKR
jgi:hypothetical protein